MDSMISQRKSPGIPFGMPGFHHPSFAFFVLEQQVDLRLAVAWASCPGDRGLLDRFMRQRNDGITTYGFSISQIILEHSGYGDLTLHGIINWTDAHSDVEMRDGTDPFTYDKVVYGVQLEWSW